MLTIKCAGCKTKLFRYRKIGQGKVLRCHKDRITRYYETPKVTNEGRVACPRCGKVFAEDTPHAYIMIRDGFTYSGTKIRT